MIIITTSRRGEPPVTHRFDGERIRIGREEDNDLVLPSPACSRHHAEIVFEEGLWKVVDCGSTNKIVVSDQRVDEYLLSEGQVFTIGEHRLEISIPDAPSAKTVAIPIGGSAEEPKAPAKVLYLHVATPGGPRGVKIVAGADYVIGRSPGADIVLDDSSCSGRHAIVLWRDDRALVRDLDSANGTFVNREPVAEAEIRPGDRVTVGRTEIKVSNHPPDTADDDVLLKRTRLGMPVPTPPDEPPRAPRVDPVEAPPISRRAVAAAVIAVVALVAVVALWRSSDRSMPVGEPAGSNTAAVEQAVVQVAPVVHKELSFKVSATGTVKPQRQVTVSAEIPGRVVSVAADQGTAIRAGQELIRLDDREIRLQIAEASSSITAEQVTLAREDFERKQRLFDDGAVTRSVLDQAKNQWLSLDAAYRSARARIAQLEERARKTCITSPLAGVVSRLEIETGELVAVGMPLAVIEDMEVVLVVVEVADRDVVRLRHLQVVEARTDAFPGTIFSGVIERVASAANPVTRAFEVEARIANPDAKLRSGMIISLQVLLDKRSALVAPAEALFDTDGESARVFVVANNVVRSASVTVGRRSDREVEVLSGLAEGDTVVVAGQDRLRDGQQVTTYRGE